LNISIELLKQYPWLPALKTFYADKALKHPIEFINDVLSKSFSGEIERRVIKIFSAAYDRLEEIQNYQADELNIYIYLIIKILLYTIDNKIITNRVANLYSKQMYNELLNERDDANIYDICTDLSLDFIYDHSSFQYGVNYVKDQIEILKTNYKIHYIEYLKLAANLHDDYRKLVHNSLAEGYVFIDRKDLLRLLQEYVRKKLTLEADRTKEDVQKFREDLLKNIGFKAIYDELMENWELKKEEFEYSFEFKFDDKVNITETFPPCIKEILRRIEEGQNIIHLERLFLVFFLHAIEYPRENILELFSRLPDFDSKIAEYQIDFAKKKEYTPHSCKTLKSLNLCMAQKYRDNICLNGYYSKKLETQRALTHPLFYVKIKQYRKVNIKKKETENKAKEKNE
jgi:DNA primase large subunit